MFNTCFILNVRIILAQKTNLIQLFERDYLNNLLITSLTEITELSNMSVWWICQEKPDHRYKIQVKERMAYRKRNKKGCSICKGYRRKQEHFIQFKKI